MPAAANTELVETPQALKSLVGELGRAGRFAIDIESNGYYNFNERTCILTVATPEFVAIIDSLALWGEMNALAPLFANERGVLCHGGSYDVASLKRDFGYSFSRIDDTMIAAQLVGIESVGLAGLAKRYLDIDLPKDLQRYNWSARPLEPSHLTYLSGDTRHLFEIAARLMAELEAKNLLEEYAIECRMLAAQPGAGKPKVDPDAFRRIKEARGMSNAQRGALKALVILRDSIAEQMDLAPFRVVGNLTLVDLVYANPRDPAQLDRMRGLSRRVVENHAKDIVEAIERGLKDQQPERAPRGDEDEEDFREYAVRPGHETREVTKQIKAWRQQESQARGIGLQAVLPTPVISEIVRTAPSSIAHLEKMPRLGKSRLERYGKTLLELAKPLTRLKRTDSV